MTNKTLKRISKLTLQIETLCSELIKFSKSDDYEIKKAAYEAFSNIGYDETIERLIDGLSDKDELIRVECLELLGYWQCIYAESEIIKCLNDPDCLVRKSAYIALSEIGRKSYIKIIEKEDKELDEREKPAYYFSMYKLGQKTAFKKFLAQLESSEYIAQCSAANLSLEIVNTSNKNKIITALKNALGKANGRAAKTSIENAILEISNQ